MSPSDRASSADLPAAFTSTDIKKLVEFISENTQILRAVRGATRGSARRIVFQIAPVLFLFAQICSLKYSFSAVRRVDFTSFFRSLKTY